MPNGKTIRMRGPDGKSYFVPAENEQTAVSGGWTREDFMGPQQRSDPLITAMGGGVPDISKDPRAQRQALAVAAPATGTLAMMGGPVAGAAMGGLGGYAESGTPTGALVGGGLGAGWGALPGGVKAGTEALISKVAARPALTRFISTGLGAVGGAGLGAAGSFESGHSPLYGAVGGAAGGAFAGRTVGRELTSAAEEAVASNLGLRMSPVERAIRRAALEAGRTAPGPWRPGRIRTTPFEAPAETSEGGTLAERVRRGVPTGARAGLDEPLVLLPEEATALERLQATAERLAKERGMQYAGGVRTAGPNVPRNRLFPRR